MKKNKSLGWVQVDSNSLELETSVQLRRDKNLVRGQKLLHPFVRRKIRDRVARDKLGALILQAEKNITPAKKQPIQMCIDPVTGVGLVSMVFAGAATLYARNGNKLTRKTQAKTGCQKLVGTERCGKDIIRTSLLKDKRGRELIRYWCSGGHSLTRYVK